MRIKNQRSPLSFFTRRRRRHQNHPNLLISLRKGRGGLYFSRVDKKDN